MKNCPFCGASPVVENFVTEAVIRCTNPDCYARIRRKHEPRADWPALRACRDAWERRYDGPEERLARAEKFIADLAGDFQPSMAFINQSEWMKGALDMKNATATVAQNFLDGKLP